MSILTWLRSARPATAADEDSLRTIVKALDTLEPDRAKYIACFAYILGRVARADHRVSDDETRAMERLVADRAQLPLEQAIIVVQMAKTQGLLFGGTEDFLITREFDRLATYDQKCGLVACLLAVGAADQSILTVEDNEIRQIAIELKVEHADFIALRAAHRQSLEVLRPRKNGA